MYNKQFKSGAFDINQWPTSINSMSASGENVNITTSLQNTTFYACVDLIAKTVSAMDLEVLFDKKKQTYGDTWRTLTLKPNSRQTIQELLTNYVYHKCLYGDFVSEVVKDDNGEIIAIVPSNGRPSITELSNGDLRYQITTFDNRQRVLNSDQVIHIKNHCVSTYKGVSMLEYLKDTLGINISAMRNASLVFKNMSMPGGFLSTEKTLSEPTQKRLVEQFQNQYGSDRKFNIGVLEDGLKFDPFTVDLGKTQLLETREFTISEICRVFGVPPELIAIQTKSTPQEIESVNRVFYQNCIKKWISEFELALKLHLRPRTTFRFDTNSLLSADKKSTSEISKTLFESGSISINEMRMRQGLPSLGSAGDVHAIDTNNYTFGRLEDIGKINTNKNNDSTDSGDQ
ncbi:phage portal protein [Shewanella algae]|uniref:phage portal protein n=1 Tax=Shewanella algae TaxID=38313 RepID=UPI00313B8201